MEGFSRTSAPMAPVWLDRCAVAPLQKGDKDASPCAELGVAVKPTLKGRLATVHLAAAVRQRALERPGLRDRYGNV